MLNVARLERKGENPTAKIIGRAAKAMGCRVLLVPERELGRFISAGGTRQALKQHF